MALVLFEEFFGVECGHAAGAGGGDGLAVAMVLYVTGDKDAGDGSLAAIFGDKVAVGVGFDFAAEGGGVGIVADGDEDAVELDFADGAGFSVADADAVDGAVAVAEDFLDDGRGDEFNFLVGARAVNHDSAGAKIIAAVDQVDFAGVAAEEVGLFHGGIAAADDGNGLAAEKETVAGGAGRDAVAEELAFGLQAEHAGRGAGSDDERFSIVSIFARSDFERATREIDLIDHASLELGAKLLGLRAHIFDELRAEDAFGKTGEILDHGGEAELAAGLVSVDYEGLEIGARGIDGGGESSATTPDNDHVMHVGLPGN